MLEKSIVEKCWVEMFWWKCCREVLKNTALNEGCGEVLDLRWDSGSWVYVDSSTPRSVAVLAMLSLHVAAKL